MVRTILLLPCAYRYSFDFGGLLWSKMEGTQPDVLFHIIVFSDLPTLLAMRATCSLFLAVVTHRSFWMNRFLLHPRLSLISLTCNSHPLLSRFMIYYRLELAQSIKDNLELIFHEPPAELPDDFVVSYLVLSKNEEEIKKTAKGLDIGTRLYFVLNGRNDHGIVTRSQRTDHEGGWDVMVLRKGSAVYPQVPLASLVESSSEWGLVRPNRPDDRERAKERALRFSEENSPQLSCAWTSQLFALYCQTGFYASLDALADRGAEL